MKKQSPAAFSLIEILVVTSVVSLAFVAVLGLVKRAIELYYYNQNFLVATMLAQEGAETVRYIRDQNWVTTNDFSTNIAPVNPSDEHQHIFALDYQAMNDRTKIKLFYNTPSGNQITDSQCANDPVSRLNCYIKEPLAKVYVDTTNHNYHSIWDGTGSLPAGYQPTIFSRLVETTYYDNDSISNLTDDFLLVTVKIFWQEKGREKTYVLNTYLFNYSWEYDNGN